MEPNFNRRADYPFYVNFFVTTVLLALAAAPALAAPDNKSTSGQRADLTATNPSGRTIPEAATTTPQSAGIRLSVARSSTGAKNARRSGPSANGNIGTPR